MSPIHFPQATTPFKAPEDLDESQVATVHSYVGIIKGGNLDGHPIVVTAWQPNAQDLERINAGGPVFLTTLGGLPPHMLATTFQDATNPPA